ncbi:MAG: serine protease inhibitor ecotin [Sphingobacteriaceae bacterium]|nr:serine protease inhibitor ecotin [Sphingobacteriaceae bacterium]
MKTQKFKLALTLLLTLGLFAISPDVKAQQNKNDSSMFPKASEGMKQVVIHLASKANENDFKVELFVGANKLIDCNTYFMQGKIEENNLEGWGYNYFTANSNGEMGGTMMGCANDKKKNTFVHINSHITRYNSKLPIVIYVPEQLEVKYRIWSTNKTLLSAKSN